MPAGRRCRFVAAALLVGTLVPLAASQDLDPAKQREEQKKIQARIDEAARRAGSTIDAMTFQRLSPSAERKTLEEVAKGLRGLSDDQIRQVLDHLEAAVKAEAAKNMDRATAEQKAALAKQRQIITELRSMLVKLDVIKSLDDAAARLDAAADKQLAVNAQTLTEARLPRRPGRQVLDSREELAGEQSDLRNEIGSIFKQVQALVPFLNAEQKDRVERANAMPRSVRLLSQMDLTVAELRSGSYLAVSEDQRRHAKELKDLAAALRSPPSDRMAALKAAQQKVAEAINAQTKVNNDTAEKPTPEEIEKARRSGFDPKMVKGNELANQQTKAEFATRDARKAAMDAAPEAAELLKPAESNQWKSEDALRQGKPQDAVEPQEKALEDLKAAKAELDRQIAAAELAKVDPLAAVKQAAERVEQLIKDQKDTNTKTEKAEKNPAKLPDAKAAQKDVSKSTDEVRKMPLPPNTDAKAALDKAADAMQQANKSLDKKEAAEAKPDQQQALKNLEEAKKALDEQAKAIEQRREEIAKLEDLKNRLEELAKNEKNVAKDADKAANDPKKPETGEIAKKQDDITPPTKDVGNELKELAEQNKNADPKGAEQLKNAAEKVGDANKNQEGAKKDLDMNMPMAGGEKAKEAAKKLDDAAKDVQAQLDQKKGQEANDQAALQPNKINPDTAAQQIQKAIEQADTAAQKANEAAKNQQPMDKGEPNIAELQKEIAKNAAEQKLPDAAKAADQAAQALEKGDLPRAIENQQKALEQLKQAQQQAMPMDKGMGEKGEKGMGEKGMGEKGEKGMGEKGEKGMGEKGEKGMGEKGMGEKGEKGMGEKGMGTEPGQLAQQQQQLLDATKALQQSQQANNAAQAALQQAQANAPMTVQPQLNQANNALQQAQNQLQQGQPGQAGQNQQNASQQLQQALNALNAAQQQQGMGMGMGMGQGQGMGMGMGQGQGKGQGQGQGMGQGQGQGKGQGQGQGMGQGQGQGMGQGQGKGNNAQQGMNQGMGEGDMAGGEKLKNANSSGNGATGDGSFINLRKKERDKVQQGADAQFPAEFRELIKQYNVNVKNAKPASGK